MKAENVSFVGSFPSLEMAPKPDRPEYAFIGRSNVGKSSLINRLVGRRNIAHTSNKPGKTQLLNYYALGDYYIVDLPGYGYAKISKSKRRDWERMIRHFLTRRSTLATAFVLVDANIPPQKIDLEFINWMGEMHIPFVITFTKTDKSKAPEIDKNVRAFEKSLLETWSELPAVVYTSSKTGEGRDELMMYIDRLNRTLVDA